METHYRGRVMRSRARHRQCKHERLSNVLSRFVLEKEWDSGKADCLLLSIDVSVRRRVQRHRRGII